MKENPLHKLTDEEVAKKRKEFLIWGMVPATVFTMILIYSLLTPEYLGMGRYAFGGLLLSLPFIFQASKYSKEYFRRQKDKS